ncbi:hypothetical protein D3C77_757530 [compost metagenome]
MEVPGHQLLAGAGFADDQRIGLAGRQALDAAEQFLGGRVIEHQHGGANGFGQFTGIGEGKQRHGAFLASESAGE